LAQIFPRARNVTTVTVWRDYRPARYVLFDDLPLVSVDPVLVQNAVNRLQRSVAAWSRGLNETARSSLNDGFLRLKNQVKAPTRDAASTWASGAKRAVGEFEETVGSLPIKLTDAAQAQLDLIVNHADDIENDTAAHGSAATWVRQNLPIFIYLNEFPELHGHQNIPNFIARSEQSGEEESDANFKRLMRVAGLDAVQLNDLLTENHEQRQLLTNHAGAEMTRKIQELWSDRKLRVRFRLDADYFDTLISEPDSVYEAEVNFDERSRGFKWFFSFYVTFAADTAGGPAEDAVLLLDEPGLHLHATGQRSLLDHFAHDFQNQIIYTTHSPFMIPIDDVPSIRTVNIEQGRGTTVSNDPTGDYRTLFPIQAALGYDLTQTMFIGEKNLIVEGVSDFWYLSSISDYVNDSGGQGLRQDLTITPAGGAQKISYMVALLTAERLKVLVLLDDEQQARNSADELVKTKLIREENVVFVSEVFSPPPPAGADIEDLLDPDLFHCLVQEVYTKDLGSVGLTLNTNIPRIVKRYEAAFKTLGLRFNKTGPAKLFLRRIASDPTLVMSPTSRSRFESLFQVISTRLDDQVRQDRRPFE